MKERERDSGVSQGRDNRNHYRHCRCNYLEFWLSYHNRDGHYCSSFIYLESFSLSPRPSCSSYGEIEQKVILFVDKITHSFRYTQRVE